MVHFEYIKLITLNFKINGENFHLFIISLSDDKKSIFYTILNSHYRPSVLNISLTWLLQSFYFSLSVHIC